MRKQTAKKSAASTAVDGYLGKEIGVWVVVFAAVFALLSVWDVHVDDPSFANAWVIEHPVANWLGYFGACTGGMLVYWLGLFAYVLPLLAMYATVSLWYAPALWTWDTLAVQCLAWQLCLVSCMVLTAVYIPIPHAAYIGGSAGIIGTHMAMVFLDSLNLLGATLVVSFGGIVGLHLVSRRQWIGWIQPGGARFCSLVRLLVGWLPSLFSRASSEPAMEPAAAAPLPGFTAHVESATAAYSAPAIESEAVEQTLEEPTLSESPVRRPSLGLHAGSASVAPVAPTGALQDVSPPTAAPQTTTPPAAEVPVHTAKEHIPATNLTRTTRRASTTSAASSVSTGGSQASPPTELPPVALLRADKAAEAVKEHPFRIQKFSALLEQHLAEFGVQGKVLSANPGPVITRFEISLAAGTKASKVTNIATDIARSLSVLSVRVVEVIPGKSCIGIEIPNEKRAMVSLKSILESKVYSQAASHLTMVLGSGINGDPVVVDLAKMPHLMVAGTTGSGKSVGLNVMLLSMLYKATPEHLRLILIDPKMLEFSVYDDIPHLLTPVITDMKDAASGLRWCVNEMERRYKLMAALGVRNIAGFNEKVQSMQQEQCADLFSASGIEVDDEVKPLPYIVVIADEFADMMMMVGKKVEVLITRLAQKVRAAGIHLILATQRPSVDVITGLIKANIPARIAFQVSSRIDSRTVLDQQGAEQLLGSGDMLYLPSGISVPIRVHGAYISDQDIATVVDHLKSLGVPDYNEDITNLDVDDAGDKPTRGGQNSEAAPKDALYDEAVAFVLENHKASISSVQRRFRIGYNRAACLIEAMEDAGVVGPMEQNGQRTILSTKPKE